MKLFFKKAILSFRKKKPNYDKINGKKFHSLGILSLEKNKKSAFSWIQRIASVVLSAVLVIPLLVSFEPLRTSANAPEIEKNLVVLLTEKNLFSSSPDNASGISGKIYRYAQDVQNALPETRVLILPVDANENSGRIFAALEKMYLEGRKTGGTLFRLSGIVVIGDIDLPIIRSAVGDMPSIFPWTDFEDPSFLWSELAEVFFENDKSREMRAEVFHGLLRAPENSEKSESEWLSEYFDKNHDFHTGRTVKPETALFSADFLNEYKSQNSVYRTMYDFASGEFFDDLAFYRYNHHLLEDANNAFFGATQSQISDVVPDSLVTAINEMESSAFDFSVPDSLIRLRIRQLLPTFSTVVSKYLEKTDGLYKASGRWIPDEEKVDFVPVIITKMDVLSREFLRQFSTDFETKIAEQAQDWQKPVFVLDSVSSEEDPENGRIITLYNYFHGLYSQSISKAEQCSLFRGSAVSDPRNFDENAQLTEMNHLYNKTPNENTAVYQNGCSAYGGCCILNIANPGACVPGNAMRDVFDFAGGNFQNNGQEPTFESCLAINLKEGRSMGWGYSGIPLYFREKIGGRFEATFHEVSSVVVRDEPRPETISAALRSGISGSIPADDPRKISWQGGGGNVLEVAFPDLFSLSVSSEESDQEVLEKIQSLFLKKEKEIRYTLFLQNLFSYFSWRASQNHPPRSKSSFSRGLGEPPSVYDTDPLEVSGEISSDIFMEASENFSAFQETLDARIFQQYESLDAFYADSNEDFFSEIQQMPMSLSSYPGFIQSMGANVSMSIQEDIYEEDEEVIDDEDIVGVPIIPRLRMESYELRDHFSVVDIPDAGFLTGDDFSAILSAGGPLLPEYLRWKSLTADEKHKRALQLFFSQNPTPISTIARENGFEIGVIHALGNAQEFWWGGESSPVLPGDDSDWEEAQAEINPNANATGSDEEEEIDECTGKPYSKGVPITEWLPAVMCWLEKTLEKPFEVEMTNSCNSTGTIDFEDEDANPDDILNTGISGIPPDSRIFFEAPSVFPLNTSQDVVIRFEKLSGDLIATGVPFTATITGGEILHSDAVQSGSLSAMTFSGQFTIPVRIFSQNAVLTITSEGFPSASFSFSTIAEGQISLDSLPMQDGDDLSLRRFALVFSDASGNAINWYGSASLSLSDSFAARLSTATLLVQGGRGEFSIQMLGTAPVALSVFADGFPKTDFSIAGGGEGSFPNQLFFSDAPDALGIRDSVIVEVSALDAVGREYSAEGITLVATSATENLANIQDLGHGQFRISALGKSGTLRLIARADAMASAVLSIPIVLKMTREEVRETQFSAPILSFLGSDFADFSEDGDPIANAALFSGSTQSVITSLNTNTIQYPRMSVVESGAIRIFDPTLEAGFSSLSPPTLKVFDTRFSDTLAEYSLSFANAEIRTDFDRSQKNPDGLYAEVLDRSGIISFSENTFFAEEQAGVTLSSTGSIALLDSHFSVEFVSEGDFPVFSVLYDGVVVGRILFVGANISLISVPAHATHFFPLPQNTDGSRGFFVSGSGKGLFVSDGGKSLERANDDTGVGFHADDDNFSLQIAAGVPVGEATKYSFGPTGVLLGDPSISLAPDTKQIGGFDRAIGHEIFRTEKDNFTGSDTFDFNADDSLDVFLGTQENRARVLKNLGSLVFRDFGDILESEFGFLSPSAGDFGGDGFDDISALDENGVLLYYNNSSEVITKKAGYLLPDEEIVELKIEDFDRDGNPDILAKLASGELSIFWNDGGFSSNNKSVLGNFGLVVETEDIAVDNTLISFPGIEERTDALVPLLLNNGIVDGEGIASLDARLAQEGYDASSDSDPDGVWAMLSGLKAQYPESFAQDMNSEQEGAVSRTALFAPIEAVPGVVSVSLLLSDENGGILEKDESIHFRLTVRNLTSAPLALSLAHAVHAAIAVDPHSLVLPQGWDRPIPTLEYLGNENTIRVRNITLLAGEAIEFSFTGAMRGQDNSEFVIRENLDVVNHPADGLPDVTLIVPGLNGLVHFVSTGSRQYTQVFDDGGGIDIPDILLGMDDADGDGFPDKFTKDENGDDRPDYSDQFFDPYKTDSDADGIVDAWDETIGNFDETGSDWESRDKSIGDVANEIMQYTKCDGGCLNIPINFAFLVPGGINIFGSLLGAVGSAASNSSSSGSTTSGSGSAGNASASFSASFPSLGGFGSGINNAVAGVGSALSDAISPITDAVEGVQDWFKNLPLIRKAEGILGGWVPGWPMFGLLPHLPYICHGASCYVPSSFFRLYLSPTLTGAVGIGICIGKGAPAGGMCVALAPSALNLAFLCDAYDDEKKRILGLSEDGECNIVSSGNATNRVSKDDNGLRGVLYMLSDIGSFSYSYNTGINRRVPMFPWNWVYAQVAEFFAMFQLPTVRIIYPDLSKVSLDTFQDRFSELTNDASKTVSFTQGNSLSAFGQTVENKIQEIGDLYEALDAIPFLEIRPVTVRIKVPYLSREQILQFIDQLENFTKDLEEEITRAKKEWLNCDAGTPVSDCSAEDALAGTVLIHYERLLATARQNINILKSYLNFPKIIASLDAMAAQWLSQVLCFLDETVLYLVSWFAKNKRRLELWIEAFYLLEKILETWEAIKDVFVNYENYCPGCYADRGGLVMMIFNLLMGLIPTPPIIEFPRLPDITLDASQIKAGIVIPLPQPKIQLVPVLFPKLPNIRLPRSPNLDIILPSLPLLPTFSLPELPPFPPTPKFTLPDLPPAPMLPDLPAEIEDLLQIAKVFLMLYCLFASGIFPYPEATALKSVIENITSRPVTAMLDVDFAGALFENIKIPSVREIRVIFQTNLDFNIGDSLVNALRDAVKPINETSKDLRRSSSAASRTLRDTLNLSDQDGKNYKIDLRSQGLPDEFQPLVDALLELQKEKENHEIAFYSPDILRARYGLPAVNLAPVHPAIPHLQELRTQIAQMRDDFELEEKTLLASNSLSDVHGKFVADSQFAAEVFDARIDTSLQTLLPERPRLLADSAPLHLDSLAYPSANPVTKSFQGGSSGNNSSLGGARGDDTFVADEEIVQNTGLFAECGDGGEKLLYSDLYEAIESIQSVDLDGDGDKDLLLQTRNSVFVKENHSISAIKNYLTTPPEIANFSEFSGIYEAVKNVRVRSADEAAHISFEAHFDESLLGVEITARERRNGYFWDEEQSEESHTLLLLPTRFLPEDVPEEYSDMTFFVENQVFSGNILIQEFNREMARMPLPQDRFWHISIREIRGDAFSTRSEIHLVAPQEQRDIFGPIVTGDFYNETTIFEPVDLSVAAFDPNDYAPNESGFDFFGDEDNGDSTFTIGDPINPDDSDNSDDNSGDNSGDNSDDNSGDNSDDNSGDNSGDNSDDNSGDNSGDNSDDNSGDNSDDNSGDNSGDNSDDNSGGDENENRDSSLPFNRPGIQKVPLTVTNSAGKSATLDLNVTVQSPEIFLDPAALQKGLVAGHIEPRIPNFPFFVVRDRNGERSKIFTESADSSGKYFTDAHGEYSIPDFSFVAGAILSNAEGDFLAQMSPKNGRLLVHSPELSLSANAQNGGGVTLSDDDNGQILARMTTVADGNSDVRLFEAPASMEQIEGLPSGVFLFDHNISDEFFSGILPGDAPSFAGGAALFDSDGAILALISRFGEVRFLDDSWSLSVAESISEDLPLVLVILDASGIPRFDFLVKTENPEIFLNNKNQKLGFSPSRQSGFSASDSSSVDFIALSHDSSVQKTEFLNDVSGDPDSSFLSFFLPSVHAEEMLKSVAPEFFTDVADTHRAARAIRVLFNRKMVSGYGDGTFRPDALITRAEFVKLVIGAAQCRNCTDNTIPELLETIPLPFPDTPRDAWYFFCVALAKFFGIVEGYGDGFLRPDQNISRAEAVAVLLRASKIPLRQASVHTLLDIPEGAWYRSAIITATELGFVDIHFGFVFPEEKITRGEFAIMAEKALEINSCTALRPADAGILDDRCPAVPEDRDGVDDTDGCPEFDIPETFADLEPGIYLDSNADGVLPTFQFSADIRKNDDIFTAILSDDELEIFSQSQSAQIPDTFSSVSP